MMVVRMLSAVILMLSADVVLAAGGKAEGPTRSVLEQKPKPPKITIMKPDGWKLLTDKQEHLYGDTYFRTLTRADCPSLLVVIVTRPADGVSVNRVVADIMQSSVAEGLVVVEAEKAADGLTLASGLAVGKLKDGRLHSMRFGVRSPKARPDLLVVVNATWTGNLSPQVREELDLIILTATAE